MYSMKLNSTNVSFFHLLSLCSELGSIMEANTTLSGKKLFSEMLNEVKIENFFCPFEGLVMFEFLLIYLYFYSDLF